MANFAKNPQVAIGRAIRLRREEVGISQSDLGLEVGHNQSWISHIENGYANPAYGTVDAIARALGWSIAELVSLAQSIETDDRKPLNKPISQRS